MRNMQRATSCLCFAVLMGAVWVWGMGIYASPVKSLSADQEAAMVAGTWYQDTDCIVGIGGCKLVGGPPSGTCPPGVKVGGVCNNLPIWCPGGQANLVCGAPYFNPFGITCGVLPLAGCSNAFPVCDSFGWCDDTAFGTNAGKCGTWTDCTN